MINYNIIASTNEATVVAEYTPEYRVVDYQSETALEKDFIHRLTQQGYEYINITDEKALISNLRTQLEKLNHYTFSDKEWEQFYSQKLANGNEGIVEKTRKIQVDSVQILTCDSGTTKNIKLIDDSSAKTP